MSETESKDELPDDVETLLRESGRRLNKAFILSQDGELDQKIKSAHGGVSAAVEHLKQSQQ